MKAEINKIEVLIKRAEFKAETLPPNYFIEYFNEFIIQLKKYVQNLKKV